MTRDGIAWTDTYRVAWRCMVTVADPGHGRLQVINTGTQQTVHLEVFRLPAGAEVEAAPADIKIWERRCADVVEHPEKRIPPVR